MDLKVGQRDISQQSEDVEYQKLLNNLSKPTNLPSSTQSQSSQPKSASLKEEEKQGPVLKKGKSYADMVNKNRGSMKINVNSSDKIIPLEDTLESPMT